MAEVLMLTATVVMAFYGCVSLIRRLIGRTHACSVRIVWLCDESFEWTLRRAAAAGDDPVIAVDGGLSADWLPAVSKLCSELCIEGPVHPDRLLAKIDEICAQSTLQNRQKPI